MVLTRNASAAAPIRVCREDTDRGRVRAAVVNSGNANAETGEQGYADALAMCERGRAALGIDTGERRRRRDRHDRRAAADRGGAAGHRRGRGRSLRRRRRRSSRTRSSTTDRWPKRCTLRVGGVTLSAQAKGAGMIEPNMATMLCFVQTDAVVEDPDAAPARRRRRLLQPDHRRRADEHQRLRPAAGHRRQRQAAAGGPAGGGPDAAGDRDRPRRRGRGPGRPDRGQRGRLAPPRQSASPGRSPTRRW